MPVGIITSVAAHLGLFGLFMLVLLTSHKPLQAPLTPPVMVDLVPKVDLDLKPEEKKKLALDLKPAEKKVELDPSPTEKEKTSPQEKAAETKRDQPAEKPAEAKAAQAPKMMPMTPQTVAPNQAPTAPPKPVQAPTPPQTAEKKPQEQPKPAEAPDPEPLTPEELEKEREAAAFRLAKHYGAILVIPDSPVGGPPSNTSAKISSPEIAALKAHLEKCWSAPAGVGPNERLLVTMRVSLSRNGTLSADPSLIQASASRHGPALVKSAEQALKSCQPYKMLPAKKYKDWKTLDLNFSPRGLTSG